MSLSRADIIDGLQELARRLASEGLSVSVHVVGGAAISIAYNHERLATVDVDAWVNARPAERADRVFAIADQVAVQRQWASTWLNDKARLFIPEGILGQEEFWDAVIEIGDVRVLVAKPDVMFAMKLRAARGRRDLPDLDDLVPILGITSAEQALALFEHYYPDEGLKESASRWIERRFV